MRARMRAGGWGFASRGVISIGEWADVIPLPMQARFIADSYAHLACYGSGFLGGLVVMAWALMRRRRLSISAEAQSGRV